jgi:hypothetical protein
VRHIETAARAPARRPGLIDSTHFFNHIARRTYFAFTSVSGFGQDTIDVLVQFAVFGGSTDPASHQEPVVSEATDTQAPPSPPLPPTYIKLFVVHPLRLILDYTVSFCLRLYGPLGLVVG